jgi:TPR repeat protein
MRNAIDVPAHSLKSSTAVVVFFVICIGASSFDVRRAAGQGLGTRRQHPETAMELAGRESEEVTRLRQAAEQGNAQAEYDLGDRYGDGNGVAKDPHQAYEWYFKAARQGLTRAEGLVGMSYVLGLGVPQDFERAIPWLQKSAEKGLVEAQFTLGLCYVRGEGVTENDSLGSHWLQKAAEQGYGDAQGFLAFQYASGKGVALDMVEAHKWMTICSTHWSNEQAKCAESKRLGERLMPTETSVEANKRAQAWMQTFASRQK